MTLSERPCRLKNYKRLFLNRGIKTEHVESRKDRKISGTLNKDPERIKNCSIPNRIVFDEILKVSPAFFRLLTKISSQRTRSVKRVLLNDQL